MSTFNLSKKLQPATKAWKSIKTNLRSKLRHPKIVKAIAILKQYCTFVDRPIVPFIHRKVLSLTRRPPPHLHHCRHLHRHNFHPSYSPIYVDELFSGRNTKEYMAESSNAKSFIKSRPDQTQPVDRVSGEVHIDGKTGLTLAAQKGRAEGGEELFPGPALLRKPYRNMADQSNSAKSANKSRPGQTQTVDRVSARVHVDDETGSAAAARKGKRADGESSKFSNAPADKWNIPMVPQLWGIDERAEEFIAKFRQDMKLEREQSILDYEEMLKRSA